MKGKRTAFLIIAFAACLFCGTRRTWAMDSEDTQNMYRLYNPNTGEHFYTSNPSERDHLDNMGWAYEGIGWVAPAKSDEPVYRLYNPNSGDHHYTVSEAEKNHLVRIGWHSEGIGWYSSDGKEVPVYRQYNPKARSGAHNYTASKAENDRLNATGWRAEGVGWYAVKSAPKTNDKATEKVLTWNEKWSYASFSKIHTARPKLYFSAAKVRKGKVVAVNAGHDTKNGDKVKTFCRPNKTAKVTGGSTRQGSTMAEAVSSGTPMADGSSEADANLALAKKIKEALLNQGYDVLMIRESEDCQLDNVARTVMANQNADCLISAHYDSSRKNKGAFCIGVPAVLSYRAMEPVKSHYEEHEALTKALLDGMKKEKISLFRSGYIQEDLTQTSYATVPAACMEAGDAASDRSEKSLNRMSQAVCTGIDLYFEK